MSQKNFFQPTKFRPFVAAYRVGSDNGWHRWAATTVRHHMRLRTGCIGGPNGAGAHFAFLRGARLPKAQRCWTQRYQFLRFKFYGNFRKFGVWTNCWAIMRLSPGPFPSIWTPNGYGIGKNNSEFFQWIFISSAHCQSVWWHFSVFEHWLSQMLLEGLIASFSWAIWWSSRTIFSCLD